MGVNILQKLKSSALHRKFFYSNTQSAIIWASGERSDLTRAKYIDVQMHFVRELIEKHHLNIGYVSSEKNIADLLTKPVSKQILRRRYKTI